MSALCRLDRIDVADDVGNRHVGRREFFDKASVAIHPVDLGRVAVKLDLLSAVSAQRCERIVVYFRAGDDRDLVVEQIGQLANDAALCLAAQTEQDDVVLGENGIDELRDDRFVVTENSREKLSRRLRVLRSDSSASRPSRTAACTRSLLTHPVSAHLP